LLAKESYVIIDAHCHASPRWFEPVETLLFQMDQNGIGCAVLTQLLGQYDNDYQMACLKAHPGRMASVVNASTADQLYRLADAGAAGVRLGATTMDDQLWQAAANAGLPVSVSGKAEAIISPAFVARIAAMPSVQFVFEHLGGIGRPDFDGSDATPADVFALSRFPNVALKIPGLGQMGKRLSLDNDPPIDGDAADLLHGAVTQFGADRLMWGSDFPPVASREGYANAIAWPMRALSKCSDAERAAIFGGTAARIFKLKDYV
jgi:L-fuconolactonase